MKKYLKMLSLQTNHYSVMKENRLDFPNLDIGFMLKENTLYLIIKGWDESYEEIDIDTASVYLSTMEHIEKEEWCFNTL